MSIKKTLGRVGIVLSVAVAVGLVGCTDEDNPGGGNYNNGEVRIGNQTWTKKNINVNTPDSWCYDNNSSNCAKYGRLYTWEAAKSVCANMGGGWRLPDTADWNKLATYAVGLSTVGKKLKAKSGWNNNGNGTDDYGFSALPGGYRFTGGSFDNIGNGGFWWSATESGSGSAYRWYMHYSYDYVHDGAYTERLGYSVRCVAD